VEVETENCTLDLINPNKQEINATVCLTAGVTVDADPNSVYCAVPVINGTRRDDLEQTLLSSSSLKFSDVLPGIAPGSIPTVSVRLIIIAKNIASDSDVVTVNDWCGEVIA
jgi:hypothetical protein